MKESSAYWPAASAFTSAWLHPPAPPGPPSLNSTFPEDIRIELPSAVASHPFVSLISKSVMADPSSLENNVLAAPPRSLAITSSRIEILNASSPMRNVSSAACGVLENETLLIDICHPRSWTFLCDEKDG